jgi:hypothetical protein
LEGGDAQGFGEKSVFDILVQRELLSGRVEDRVDRLGDLQVALNL